MDQDFSEPCGIEWSLNSCFIDSVLFAMFSFQDTFDNWILKDFEEVSPEKHKKMIRSQTMLRKIVNYLRNKGYVNSEIIYQWRCYLYNECDIEVAFKHSLKKEHSFHLCHVNSKEKPQKLNLSNAFLDLQLNKTLSSEVVLEPDYKIDFTSAKVSGDVPAKIFFNLYPKHKKYIVNLTHEFEAEFADATEFLQSIMELFELNTIVKTRSVITSSCGELYREDINGILFLGVPDDANEFTIQELLNKEYIDSKAFFYDKNGIRHCNTTTIASIEGNGLLLALKRMQPNQKDKARQVPVYVESYLEINDEIYELMSIVCQYQNHYHTFTRHQYDKNQWFYYNDKGKRLKNSENKWQPTVVPLSRGFGFHGFSQITESEKKLKSLITTSGYLFTYRKKT